MKKLLHNKKLLLLLIADLLLIPALFACRELSKVMLSQESTCVMVLYGGQCITCGGTHFVKTLLSGQMIEAFHHNSFLFILTVIFAVSYILLHLFWLAKWEFVGKVLKTVYSIPGLIVVMVWMLGFFFVRNIPVFIKIANILFQ